MLRGFAKEAGIQLSKVLRATAGLLLLSAVGGHSAEYSVRGLELGMTAPQAIQSVSGDLRDGSQVNIINSSGSEKYRMNSREWACRWADMNRTEKCIAFVAFGRGNPEKGGLNYIRLEQFFEKSLQFAAFEQQLRNAYGEPALAERMNSTQWSSYSSAYWLWSPEPFAMTSEAKSWASSHAPEAWNVSEPGKKFGLPVLHLSAYLRNGEVAGMRMVLFDPKVFHSELIESREWQKRMNAEKEQNAREAAEGLQLR